MWGILKWFGNRALKRIKKTSADNLTRAVQFYCQELRRAISKQGVPIDRRSLPGESPRKETGFLHKSIYYFVDRERLIAYVALDDQAFYGHILEKGTKDGKLKPRPWKWVTWAKNKEHIVKLAGRDMTGISWNL